MIKKTNLSFLVAILLPFTTASAFDVYENEDVTIGVGGRLQLDTTFPVDDAGDAYDFRAKRARLFIEGEFDDWEAKLQFDFAKALSKDGDGNYVEIKDAWIKYKGLGAADIKAGQFKAAMSLNELTSSKYITLFDRALVVDELAISRKVGVAASQSTDVFTLNAGVYGQGLQDSSDTDEWGPVGRVVFHPFGKKDGTVHLAGSAGARWNNQDEENITYGLEVATVLGPVHTQAEYMDQETSYGDSTDESVSGWYTQAGWFLTGEKRPYKAGAFKGVKPLNKKLGAWEIAGRYGEFEDEDRTTVGLNWYANPYVRLGVDYSTGTKGNVVLSRVQFAL